MPIAAESELTSFGRDLGTGAAFPVTGPEGSALRRGDVFLRTDLGTNGSLWTYVGGSAGSGGWVHKGPITCTSTTRPGSALYGGLAIFETDTNRMWQRAGTAWVYAGGAPPPTYACTMQTGFSAFASLIPVAFQDASGLCHLQGIVSVTTAFSAATPILQLPSQVPAPVGAGEGFPLMVHNNAAGLTLIRVSIDGTGKLNFAEGAAVAAGSYIYLLGTTWHPTSPGATGLA